MPRRAIQILGLLLSALPMAALAAVYPLPPDDVDVIGEFRSVAVEPGETLLDIARRYSVGYEEMQRANPGVDMWAPPANASVVIPTRHILPSGPRRGLVVNLAEMRLYYFPPAAKGERRMVETYPISIGRMDWQTPLGETRVVAKQENPSWYPPQSVRIEAEREGLEVPKVVPPGPDNPLGSHVLRLGLPAYLIHGTNNPWGIGMRVTHGCVRMYPEDIQSLYERVPVNTPVRLVNEPYKAGWFAGTLYVEAHPVLEEHRTDADDGFKPLVERLTEVLGSTRHRVDYTRLRQALAERSGLPVAVSRNGS